MIKLRVLVDGFCIGMHSYKKGDIIEVLPPSVGYAIGNGNCEVVKAKPAPSYETPKKKSKKKSSYATKVMEAE